jgi:hypothetical protein
MSLYHYPANPKNFNTKTAATMLRKYSFISVAPTLPHLTLSYPEDIMNMYMGNDSRDPIGDVLKGGHDTSTPLAFNAPLASDLFSPANIWGAVNVHDSSTWPEKQKVFIMYEEPAAEPMTEVLNQTVCDSASQGFELDTYGWVGSFFIKEVYD